MADDIDLREALDAAISAVDAHEPALHASVAALGVALQAAAPLLIEQARRQALSEAYWRIREHASGYRGTELFQRTRERWEASGRHDKDALVKVVTHEFFARGIESAADEVAALLGLDENDEPEKPAL
jgi:hypothetical protein